MSVRFLGPTGESVPAQATAAQIASGRCFRWSSRQASSAPAARAGGEPGAAVSRSSRR